MQTTEITLPNGFVSADGWRRTARLRAMTGEEQGFLRDEGAAALPVQRTTALLMRCLTSLGGELATEAAVRDLTIGDREALLWHLRRLTFGETITCLMTCPSETCGEKMELELEVADLFAPPGDIAEAWREREIDEDDRRYRFRFRLPTGADQEAAAERWARAGSVEDAAHTILERCLSGVWANEEPVHGIPPAVARALPALFAECDPQAELQLNLVCPVCETAFGTLLDAGLYLYQELQAQGDLYRDVHRLASAYHWSEADILALPLPRRRLYLSLIAERGGL